ncbi:hypothetical protein BH11PAT3_BH11PAT3_3100 [soil metagenome]
MDSTSAEEKKCLACEGVVVDGVCTNCSTKVEDSKADIKDENFHGGVVAEATPSMSEQTMGEDMGPKDEAGEVK